MGQKEYLASKEWVLYKGDKDESLKSIKDLTGFEDTHCEHLYEALVEEDSAYQKQLREGLPTWKRGRINIEWKNGTKYLNNLVSQLPLNLRKVNEDGGRIDHIKAVKAHTGWGLRECKHASDHIIAMKKRFKDS